MIRQTGGLALGATSTRSSSCSRDRASASGRGRTPSCSPSAPTRNTSRARMRSLILTSCAAMWSPASSGDFLPREETGPGRDDGGHGHVRHQTTTPHPTLRCIRCRSGRTTCGPGAPGVLRGAGGRVGIRAWIPLPCEFLVVLAGRVRFSCQDTRVSSLWTPSGEHRPEEEPAESSAPVPPAGGEPTMSQEDYEELLR